MVHVAQEHHHYQQQHQVHHHGAQEQQAGPEAVGRRLSLVLSKTRCPAMIVAYFPKTRKHRIRFDGTEQHEKNVLLNTLDYSWVNNTDKQLSSAKMSSYELAIRRHAVGRRMEVFHHVRQRWYQATVLQYVEHCQQHTVVLEPQGKVHLVDLQQCPWRYTDLIGPTEVSTKRNPRDLATSKYMGVVRCAENAWKAYYSNTSENKYIGCFESEKDAALAYDVYARKRQTTVNFLDRRICRAQMKLLRIAEPEPEPAVMEEVPSTPVAVPVTVTVTPEMVESLPELPSKSSTADIVMTSSTEEESSAPVMDAEAPVEMHIESNSNTRPDPEGVLASSMVEEVEPELDVECAVEQQTQDPPEHSGRVTPVSVTEEVLGHDEHSTASHTTEEEEDNNQSSLDDSATSFPQVEELSQRRISTSSEEDLPEAAAIKATAAQAARVNIFEDSEDEQECPVKTDKASTVTCDNNNNIFESDIDDDEESVHVTPRRKRKKKDKSKSFTSHRRHRRVIEETHSSDEDEEEMDSSEYLPSPEPRKKVKEIKLPTSTTSQKKKKKKRKRSSSPTPAATPYQHKYPVGTRFMKEFEDFGSFEGVITAHNGRHYQVYYAADGDEEELSEYEFENYEILPSRNAAHSSSSKLMACPPTPIAQKRQKNCHRRKKKRRANAILD